MDVKLPLVLPHEQHGRCTATVEVSSRYLAGALTSIGSLMWPKNIRRPLRWLSETSGHTVKVSKTELDTIHPRLDYQAWCAQEDGGGLPRLWMPIWRALSNRGFILPFCRYWTSPAADAAVTSLNVCFPLASDDLHVFASACVHGQRVTYWHHWQRFATAQSGRLLPHEEAPGPGFQPEYIYIDQDGFKNLHGCSYAVFARRQQLIWNAAGYWPNGEEGLGTLATIRATLFEEQLLAAAARLLSPVLDRLPQRNLGQVAANLHSIDEARSDWFRAQLVTEALLAERLTAPAALATRAQFCADMSVRALMSLAWAANLDLGLLVCPRSEGLNQQLLQERVAAHVERDYGRDALEPTGDGPAA